MESSATNKAAYWTCVAYSTALMMSTNVASGIYPLYKLNHILTSFQITEVFAAYVFGLIPALLLSSWMSQKFGLRTVIITAMIFAIFGTAILGFSENFLHFIPGRILQGIAVGLSTGNLAAAVIRYEPSGKPHRATLSIGLAMTMGGGFAPIIGSIAAQYFTRPTLTPFILILTLLALLLPLSVTLPNSKQDSSSVSWPRVPILVRDAFKVYSTAAFLAWSVAAMFLSVIPVVVAGQLKHLSLIIPAASAGAVLVISGVTQAVATRMHPRAAFHAGYFVLAITGMLLVLGELSDAVPVVLLSSIIGGIGHGLIFLGATRLLNEKIGGSETRTEILAAYNLAIYLGVGVPALCIGGLSTFLSSRWAICVFGGYVVTLCLYGLAQTRTNFLRPSMERKI